MITELECLNERKKNMQLINDQVGGWTQRVCGKLSEQLQGVTIDTAERSVAEIMREIATLAKGQLQNIKQRQATDEEESVVDKDYIGEFANDDYITKNIRVIPMGGLSLDKESEHTSKHFASAMGATGNAADSDVEDAKHNQDAYIQMMEQRNLVKEKRNEWERKEIERAEREAKLKQKLK